MTIQQFALMGHVIRFGDDGPYEGRALWKTKIDNGIWSPGRADLAAELQDAIDDVVSMERGAPVFTNYLAPRSRERTESKPTGSDNSDWPIKEIERLRKALAEIYDLASHPGYEQTATRTWIMRLSDQRKDEIAS